MSEGSTQFQPQGSYISGSFMQVSTVPGVARVLNEPFWNNRIVHRYHIKFISICITFYLTYMTLVYFIKLTLPLSLIYGL